MEILLTLFLLYLKFGSGDEFSQWRPFADALPTRFNTGLAIDYNTFSAYEMDGSDLCGAYIQCGI